MLESVRQQLMVISFAALLFLALAVGLTLFADPFHSPLVAVLSFYVCVTGFTLNLFTIIIYAIRNKFSDGLHFQKISIALRESVLLTVLVVGLLFLSAQNLFYWWIVSTFVLALVFIEGFFLI